MEKEYLKEIGLTEGEIKVYLALLQLGSSSSGKIAKEAGVSRSKLYEISEKLIRKGLVSHYERNNVSYFTAAPPQRIIDFIGNKEKKLEEQKVQFEKMLPYFEGLIGKRETVKEAQVFEGTEGIKNIRETALKETKPKENFYFFGNPASGHENILGYWDDWNQRRIKKKITSWTIYNQDAQEYGERRKKQPFTKVKYLPQKGNTHAWIEIYGDTIAIAMKHETPMSIVIHNKNVAESFKTYFKILWDVSSEKIKH
ncbi:MAG: helix-turn-helix domain-containing protein [Candidatus Woesearchaeota archaeon]|jgi:sugar-specific transcriptional regulator TrmB